MDCNVIYIQCTSKSYEKEYFTVLRKDITVHSHIFHLEGGEAKHKKFYHQSKATMKPNEVNLYSFLRAVKPVAGTPETIRERKNQGLWDPQCTSVQKP
jgi:hypothetical protein